MIQTIDVALSQLGVFEATGRNDGVPAKRYMRGDELAWCAGFVLWCNEHSDDPDMTPDDWTYYHLRSVSSMIKHFRKLGCLVEPSRGYTPQRNDIIFFGKTASDVGVTGSHVGIVEACDGARVFTVEGNTSNKVAKRSYPLHDKTIVAYGVIKPALAVSVAPSKKK